MSPGPEATRTALDSEDLLVLISASLSITSPSLLKSSGVSYYIPALLEVTQ